MTSNATKTTRVTVCELFLLSFAWILADEMLKLSVSFKTLPITYASGH